MPSTFLTFKVWFFRYSIHLLFITIEHCTDEKLIFQVVISNTTQFRSITSIDYDVISIFVIKGKEWLPDATWSLQGSS